MEPLQKLKILLVDRAANYTDEYLSLVLDEVEAEALAYCRREDVPDGLAVAVVRMALVKVNRTGSDGLSSQGYSGTSEAYIDGYPAEIADILRRYRKLVVL